MGQPITKEWTYKRKNGSTFPVLLSIKAVKNKEVITGYSAVAVDISVLKQAEAEIKSLLEITQDKNSRLRNFAHIVSHNLRSHSIGISGILDLIEMQEPELYENEWITLIQKGVDNMKQTVEDLTDVVRVNLTANVISEVKLFDTVQKNIDLVTYQSSHTGITIDNQLDSTLVARGVPAYLDSISLNLITNAVKYRSTDRESYLKISASNTTTHTILSFEDNGQGIDLNRHGEKLFGMYKTFHQHPDAKGVGLFITKNQVESMGGKIEVQSKVDIGTTFQIYLPL